MMTVMFSSRNGASVLPRTLESLARATPPSGGWKLVAVDNASTDGSVDLIRAYADRLPVTALTEPVAGKNRAINRALELAEGDLYVFCDDDVVVADDWLVKWRETADAHPQADLFGGRTEPLWPFEPPKWIFDDLDEGKLSIVFATNLPMREGPCEAVAVFGTNMAIRASALAGGIRFNVDIGPSAARAYPMGSETELLRRLAAKGHKSWFAQGVRVGHIIRPQQMDRAWVVSRAYRWGRGRAHMEMPHSYKPGRLARKNWLRAGLYPILMPVFNNGEAWARQWEWAVDQGYEDGWRERRGMRPRWIDGAGPRVAARFRRGAPVG